MRIKIDASSSEIQLKNPAIAVGASEGTAEDSVEWTLILMIISIPFLFSLLLLILKVVFKFFKKSFL